MPKAVVVDMVQCYRFKVEAIHGPTFLPLPEAVEMGFCKMSWEGPHLIVTRGIYKGASKSLFEEAQEWHGFLVELFDKEQTSRKWKIQYERVQNRGFLFLDAAKSEVALEAVCFVNAEMVAA